MPDEPIVLVLTPAPCDVPVNVRLRQLLKTAGRRDRLRCVSVFSGPLAWCGWLRPPDCAWVLSTTATSPELAMRLLAEAAPQGATLMVLPRGVRPS